MMTIGSVSGANNNMQAGGFGMNMQTDSVSKNIQKQIANAQKKLQELSSNEDMEMEEKMKKRQEIQQEITSLNQQLRQHQMEQRKQQQSKKSSTDHMLGGNQKVETAKSGNNSTGLSQASMQAMISADSSMKQACVQGNMVTQLEGKAGVLKSEIMLDASRKTSTEKKEKELADLQEKAQEVTISQLSTLSDANKTIEEARKADRKVEREESKEKKTDETTKLENERQKAGEVSEEIMSQSSEQKTKSPVKAEKTEKFSEDTSRKDSKPVTYTSIDLRL